MAKNIVKFNIERCKGCELCSAVCPVKIIHLDERVMNSKGYQVANIQNMEKCTRCANCAIICPDGAISVYTSKNTDKGAESYE